MLTMLFTILLILIFGKLLIFAIKASWGLAKILLSVLIFPLVLVGLVAAGLIYIAFPVLLIVGLVSIFAPRA